MGRQAQLQGLRRPQDRFNLLRGAHEAGSQLADLLQCLHEMLPEVRLEVPIRVAGKLYIACASVCERVRECVGERVADVGSASGSTLPAPRSRTPETRNPKAAQRRRARSCVSGAAYICHALTYALAHTLAHARTPPRTRIYAC